LLPTAIGISGIAVKIAAGMPTRSISFATIAPQRLQLPQVATNSAAPTLLSFSSFAILAPKLSESF